MILPMVIMQLGIFVDYWGYFVHKAWSVHVHYWTGTLWYLFLIIQPYDATHGKLDRHRTNGIIGMFIAGGVSITALSMLHRDLMNANNAMQFPERFGAFKPWFFYGVAVVEFVMMSAFIYAVVQSIIHRKRLEDHAWWLISTVFIIMMPALARGIQNAWMAVGSITSDKEVMLSIFLSEVIIIALALWAAVRYGRLNHPATYVVVGVNLFNCLLEPLGKSEWIQATLEKFIQ